MIFVELPVKNIWDWGMLGEWIYISMYSLRYFKNCSTIALANVASHLISKKKSILNWKEIIDVKVIAS